MLRAFQEGDPEAAYQATLALVEGYRELATEVARLRFAQNFGSALCEDCDGLRAGPGVVATCYQTKQCNFNNVKESDASPRHLRVLTTLLGDRNSP